MLASEWQVLAVFAQNAASVVSLLELQKATEQNVSMIRARIGTLRLRLEDDPKHPRLLTTVPGRGYRLELLP